MRKRIIVSCLILAMIITTTGCGRMVELTDEENHLIAEYAAELLLKYNKKYGSRYEESDIVSEEQTTEMTDSDTTTEVSTETELSTEATTETTEATTEAEETTTESTTEEFEPIDDIVVNVDKDYNIAKLAGEDNISIKYAYYMILDKYPSYDEDGVYIEIEAQQGYKLCVLKFNVENITNSEQCVDLYSKDIDYKLIVDNKRAAKPMFTILIDDLYTYQKNMEGSLFEEAVLLFQVSDSVAEDMKDIKFSAEYNGKKAVMQLQ